MPEEQKRLENVLLNFIENASINTAAEKEAEDIPGAALALIELWKIYC